MGKNEEGFTLIEVVASLLIIIIILLGFISLFFSTTKSTKNADNMFNATYYAQQKMEEIYIYAKNANWNSTTIESVIPTSSFEKLPPGGDILAEYNYFDTTNDFYCTLRVKKYSPSALPVLVNNLPLTNIIIEIRENKQGEIKEKMENIIEWKGI
ncbi:type IV pilus modification PilV family protein [Lysinibacillus boronitolerans]|uniref:type IV pilus modification PilV family protein n=1 Tax=Lysinibacillus boronitolerans TaxID=309788 RepID=UPI003851C565